MRHCFTATVSVKVKDIWVNLNLTELIQLTLTPVAHTRACKQGRAQSSSSDQRREE